MILEGIVTTLDARGDVNVSPMGPRVTAEMQELIFRPFQSSRTFANLCRDRQGVLHVVDNVELLARAAVGQLPSPPTRAAQRVAGRVLQDCCRWYEFEVAEIDQSQPRATIAARVVHRQFAREFFGFNRAKHAVVEAAILATRLQLLPHAEIVQEFQRLEVIVEKTAGEQETRAFAFLKEFVANAPRQQH